MKIILYEAEQVKSLYPITLTRPAFDILCGGLTLFDLIKREFKGSKIDFICRDYLVKTTEKKYKRNLQPDNKILFLNAQLVPSFEVIKLLAKKISNGQSRILKNKNEIVGAYLDLSEIGGKNLKNLKFGEVDKFFASLELKAEVANYPVFNYSWQVVTYNEEILAGNLKYLKEGYQEKTPGVYVGKNVKLSKEIVLNASHGPIIIGDGTEVLPYCHLVGPLYIGKNCLIREFTVLKYSCCFGDICKMAGEIETTVVQGYSNKNHYGSIGHSYIGEWVNLGAGTVNSTLKNNYSPIRVNGVDTGHLFLGNIFADYSRTAINTAIYTGKTIGVNSHLYGTIFDDVPSFTVYAKNFGCLVEFSLEKTIELQKAVFARRGKKQEKADIDLLKKVFELTAADRKNNKVKKGKIVFK